MLLVFVEQQCVGHQHDVHLLPSSVHRQTSSSPSPSSHTDHLNSHFLSEPGLAGCTPFPLILFCSKTEPLGNNCHRTDALHVTQPTVSMLKGTQSTTLTRKNQLASAFLDTTTPEGQDVVLPYCKYVSINTSPLCCQLIMLPVLRPLGLCVVSCRNCHSLNHFIMVTTMTDHRIKRRAF